MTATGRSRMYDSFLGSAGIALLVAGWPGGAVAQQSVPSARQLTVDLSDEYRPATHVASGSLYGLSDSGPDHALLAPTKPIMFTQMAPGGTQVKVGDALKVAQRAAAAGAKITIRLPDIYPNFPYRWVGWDDWNAKVDGVVAAVATSGVTNVYAYELWNEPNWTWDYAAAGSFLDAWSKTHARIRARDAKTAIMGPSIDRWDPVYMKAFLVAAKAAGTLPEIVSWHELGFPEGEYQSTANTPHIRRHIAEYRALEKSLGIAPLRISINEYGVTTEEGVPGSMIRYFAQFERGGVESANVAFWFTPGTLSNLVTPDGRANGGWWLFKWYGDMTGRMAMTVPAAADELNLDGIASVAPDRRSATLLFGGADGDNLVVVKGFPPAFRGRAHVRVEATPWLGPDTAVAAPRPVFEGAFAIRDGTIAVPITGLDKAAGYRMTLTPAGNARTRYEAEGALRGGDAERATPAATASDGAYVRGFAAGTAPLAMVVSVPTAGRYRLEVRYANGGSRAVDGGIAVNGADGTALSYPMTGGGLAEERTGLAGATVTLRAGRNRITLSPGDGALDLDYVQVAPEPGWPLRLEAEKAAIASGMVEPSSYASGQYFVAPNTAARSGVTFFPDVREAGPYVLQVGYANVSAAAGKHELTVNGATAGTVGYPSTGGRFRAVPTAGPRRVVSVPVTLNAGRNTIRLSTPRAAGIDAGGVVELDYIELQPAR